MLHFYNTPYILKHLSKHLVWEIPTSESEIYLTFDDGPIPHLTDYVLTVLDDFDAKATFFCVGENIFKYPNICEQIASSGHLIGNHTFNHLNGWATNNEDYFRNIEKCQALIAQHQGTMCKAVFRPPYGKISKSQITALKDTYQIIMWNILTYDFDYSHSSSYSLNRIIQNTRPGSVVVFHDNYKAEKKLKYMLPRYLEHFQKKGYVFKKIDPEQIQSPAKG